MVYSLRFFSLQNAVCFIILTYLVPVLFTFYIQGVLKLKKNNYGTKRLIISSNIANKFNFTLSVVILSMKILHCLSVNCSTLNFHFLRVNVTVLRKFNAFTNSTGRIHEIRVFVTHKPYVKYTVIVTHHQDNFLCLS